MKTTLPIKLGIFVLVLFALVIATCLLWTPVKIRYYTAKLKSGDPKERVAGVDELLKRGALGQQALAGYYGCSNEEVEFIKKYWDNVGSKIEDKGDGSGFYPILFAAIKGYTNAVRLFIEKGADVNARDDDGWTPLHRATVNEHICTTAFLIEKVNDLEVKDNYGRTPLNSTGMFGCKDAAALLIEKGSKMNTKDNNGWTPLHSSICSNNEDVATFLIEKGTDVNSKDNDGRTALH
ncbi:MAG: ankyrin repeat domain-containing protein, partial [Planctomycetota bacterium]